MKESDLQKECVKVFGLKYPIYRKLIWHYPSGGYRKTKEAVKFKKMGVKAGVPDLMLMVPRGGFHALFVELKTKKGTVTDHQRNMMEALKGQGYYCVVCRSTSEFLEAVDRYLSPT